MLITAAFPSEAEVQVVVEALESSGVDRAQIGVLTTADSSSERDQPGRGGPSRTPHDSDSAAIAAGAWIGGLAYLGAATAAGLVILAGGGLGLALAAVLASGGGGGLVGALIAAGFHRHHAEFVEEQLQSGGVTLWVDTRNEAQTATVRRIFDQHHAVHPVETTR
jgi:hypothetical protein